MPETTISPILVGRIREMQILDRALGSAQSSKGTCVLIAGEAGIGKSRLASELQAHAIEQNFSILRGYCSEQDKSFPYAPWIDALRTFLAPLGAAEVNDLLGIFAPELIKLLPELALLMPSLRPIPPLDPADEKHRLFETLARFTSSLAAVRPLLIILEDLQWSDEQSLELIQFLARRITAHPILILGTYRPDEESPRSAYHLTEMYRSRLMDEIRLEPLARPDVNRMVQAILKTEQPLSADWLDLLMPLTEGNPFFVEEITKSLLQSGTQPNQWEPSQIPHSIQHTIQRRVGDLGERARRIMSLASVIGERFDFGLLSEITGENEQALSEILKELITAQLIVEQSADQFEFRHALTRQVVYSGLMLRERKALHQKIGESVEHTVGTQMEAPIALLAYHFYQAGDWQKAIKYSQHAGEKAQALYATREALAHFSNAVEAARNLNIPAPLPSMLGRAKALGMLSDFDDARVEYETIIDLAHREKERSNEWQALMELGYVWQPRDLERAGEYFKLALQLARTMDDAAKLGQSLNRLGNWYFFRSQPREALTVLGEALEIFQKIGDRRGMAVTLQLMGVASSGIGDVIQGTAYYKQAIPLLRAVDDRQGLVRALEFLCMQARLDTEVLGEVFFSQLVAYGEQAYEIAHNFDWREGEGEALSRTAICWNRVGEYGRGLELLQRAQVIGEELEHRHLLASVHLLRGEWYLNLLSLDQARYHLELAFTFARQVGALQLLKSASPLLVSTCILQKDLQRAQEVLEVLSLPDDEAEIEIAEMFDRLCWSTLAELELAQRHPQRALDIVNRLIHSAQNITEFGPHSIPWLSQLRAQALAVLGDYEDAADELIGAQATAQARGELPLLWRLHADLGIVYRTLGRRHDAEQEFSSARVIIRDLAELVPDDALRTNFLHMALEKIPAEHVPTQRQVEKKEHGGLTARQHQVAALIAHGKSNREIANELFISEKTAERHVANILSKLGFEARTQIAAWIIAKQMDK